MVKLTPSTARVGVFVFRIFHGTFLDKHTAKTTVPFRLNVNNVRKQRDKHCMPGQKDVLSWGD